MNNILVIEYIREEEKFMVNLVHELLSIGESLVAMGELYSPYYIQRGEILAMIPCDSVTYMKLFRDLVEIDTSTLYHTDKHSFNKYLWAYKGKLPEMTKDNTYTTNTSDEWCDGNNSYYTSIEGDILLKDIKISGGEYE